MMDSEEATEHKRHRIPKGAIQCMKMYVVGIGILCATFWLVALTYTLSLVESYHPRGLLIVLTGGFAIPYVIGYSAVKLYEWRWSAS